MGWVYVCGALERRRREKGGKKNTCVHFSQRLKRTTDTQRSHTACSGLLPFLVVCGCGGVRRGETRAALGDLWGMEEKRKGGKLDER